MNRRQTLQSCLLPLGAWAPVSYSLDTCEAKQDNAEHSEYFLIDTTLYDDFQPQAWQQAILQSKNDLRIEAFKKDFKGTIFHLCEEQCLVRSWTAIRQQQKPLLQKPAIQGLTLPSDFALVRLLAEEDRMQHLVSQPHRVGQRDYVFWQLA